MSIDVQAAVGEITAKYHNDRNRLMDIVREAASVQGYLSEQVMQAIADQLKIHRIEVLDMVSFYHFFSLQPAGRTDIRLCKAVVEKMMGMEGVAQALEREVGVPFGQTSADGKISLSYTSCIGMSDQAPSALINGQVVTHLEVEDVADLVKDIRSGKFFEHRETSPLGMVSNNLIQRGEVIFASYEPGKAIRAALSLTQEQVINELNVARLRGRGGAGFPTAMKWDFCRKAKGEEHIVICNADEGEPGTFKDRVVFTELADLVFEGMTVAGYAVGAKQGFLYLRAEYLYLYQHLKKVLNKRRKLGLLGQNICGKEWFDFDIRIQLGAGAYICGEESSLIESLEGKRGAPRDRPPFPVTKGYQNYPTAVNNVETLCAAARVMEKGGEWFSGLGTRNSTGTKLLSISGDCKNPGVYEIEFGMSLDKILGLCQAEDVQAVQIGGPSGICIAPKDFGRCISFEDLSTGGSFIVFSRKRDLLKIARDFTEFFVDESCGWCAPCRVGTILLLRKMDKILSGKGGQQDLYELEKIGETVRNMSRCGLGQTASNPVLTVLKNFRSLYLERISDTTFVPSFDLKEALQAQAVVTGRGVEVEEE